MELCFTSSVRFLQPGLLLKVRRVQLCGSAAVPGLLLKVRRVQLCGSAAVPGLLLKVRRVQLCGCAAVLDPECGALGSAVGQLLWHGLDSHVPLTLGSWFLLLEVK